MRSVLPPRAGGPLFLMLTLVSSIAPAYAASVPADASELLAAAIQYHDPEGLWQQSAWRLVLEEARPDGSHRETTLVIDNANQRFEWTRQTDGASLEGKLVEGSCTLRLDGKTDFSAEERDEHGLTCDRLETRRDYYTYLWSLPMKLRDPGTQVAPEVQETTFDGRPALGLRVTYDEPVGKDTWYFYFDPTTHALAGYRFYHDEAANDGEYILLSGETESAGLRVPKTRTWYTHAEDELLGTDTLAGLERLER